MRYGIWYLITIYKDISCCQWLGYVSQSWLHWMLLVSSKEFESGSLTLRSCDGLKSGVGRFLEMNTPGWHQLTRCFFADPWLLPCYSREFKFWVWMKIKVTTLIAWCTKKRKNDACAGLGPAGPPSATLGPAALGPATLGPATLGPAALGPANLGPAALGPATLGPANLGPAHFATMGARRSCLCIWSTICIIFDILIFICWFVKIRFEKCLSVHDMHPAQVRIAVFFGVRGWWHNWNPWWRAWSDYSPHKVF